MAVRHPEPGIAEHTAFGGTEPKFVAYAVYTNGRNAQTVLFIAPARTKEVLRIDSVSLSVLQHAPKAAFDLYELVSQTHLVGAGAGQLHVLDMLNTPGPR